MSDLISRKKICDYIKGKINPYGKPFEGTAYELGLKIMRYIDAMESAYDVDKVVEELEKHKDTTDLTTVDEEMILGFTIYQGAFNEAIDKAIEIVKQGGVSNDVCEWEKYPFDWFTGCDGYRIYNKQGDYCPRCGKMIKVKVAE